MFVNAGRGVDGTVTVNEYDVAAGRLNVAFHGVTLPASHGAGRCVLDGSLVTAGLTP